MPILKSESYKKGIVYSTFLNIVSKGLVFGNSLVVAFYFGTQLTTDIYFYVYNTIVILSAFITSLNASVLIPESMRIRIKEGDREANRFLNLFIYGYATLTLLIILVFLINPVSIFNAISSFDHQSIQEERNILLLAVPLIIMMPLVNLLTDIMASCRYFTMPMVAGIINGIFSISFVVLFHGILDILSLLSGLIVSYAINLIMLIYLMKKNLYWNFRFSWIRLDRRIWKNIGFAQAGNITSSLCTYAPLYLLSGFSAGIITSLNFAQQISSLPSHLITNQFSAVTGIKFNEQYAKGDFNELNQTFVSTSGFLLFILFPISGIMFLFSDEMVSFLLERGAFGEKGVTETALFLKYLGLMAPLLAINTLFARLFMAAHKIAESFWYQIIINIAFIILLYFSIQSWGPIGYPMAMIGIYLLNVFFSYFLEKRYFNFINYSNTIMQFFKIIVLNLFMLLIVEVVIKRQDFLSPVAGFFLGSAFYIFLVVFVGMKLKVSPSFNTFFQLYAGKLFMQRKKSAIKHPNKT